MQPQQQQQPNGPYGSLLLNDLHANFPALLYLPGRFNSVQDVLFYVQQQMSARYDLFSSWRAHYERLDREAAAAAAAAQAAAQAAAAAAAQQPRYNHRYNSRWTHPERAQRNQEPRPRVQVPPSPEVQVTAEVDQTALNAFINQAFLAAQPINPTTDMLAANLIRSIFGPFDNAAGNRTTAALNATAPFWEPVLITPTAAQVAAASTTYAAPTALDTPCAICQDIIAEGAQVRKLTFCNHFFHKDCVDNWFLRDTRCPTCRHDVRVRSANAVNPSAS
jgi:E3 ubiquitin-protein ligase ATL10/75/76/77/78